jgi:hypothetical protein
MMEENELRTLEKIKELLKDRERRNCPGTISYTELGKELGLKGEDVRVVVGGRLVELTPQPTIRGIALGMKVAFSGLDPDFYLLGDNITEISKNKDYQEFRKKHFMVTNRTIRAIDIGSRLP